MQLRFLDRRKTLIAVDLAARLNAVAAMGDTAAAAFHARGNLFADPAHAGSIAEMTTHVGPP
jgi:hypothetical protein